MHPISSRDENDSQSSTKEVSQLFKSPQEEPSLRNRYVRGTLCFLPQVEWTPRFAYVTGVQTCALPISACSLILSFYSNLLEISTDKLELQMKKFNV